MFFTMKMTWAYQTVREKVCALTNGLSNEKVYRQIVRMDGWMNGWMEGRTVRPTNEQTDMADGRTD